MPYEKIKVYAPQKPIVRGMVLPRAPILFRSEWAQKKKIYLFENEDEIKHRDTSRRK